MKRTDLKVGEDYGLHASADWNNVGRHWIRRPERVRLVTDMPVHIPSREQMYARWTTAPAVIVNLPDAEGVAVKGARTVDKYHVANGVIVREVNPDGKAGSLRAVRLSHLRAPWAVVEQVLAEIDKAAQDAADARAKAAQARTDRAQAVRRIARKYQVDSEALAGCLGRYTTSAAESWRVDPLIDLILTMEIEGVDVPALEDYDCANCDQGQAECAACGGSGKADGDGGEQECGDCGGEGTEDCTECDGEGHDVEAWRSDVEDATSIVNESPV